MNLTLNNHMKLVLKNGVELLCDHQDQIIKEWAGILEYMKIHHKKSAHAFEFAFSFFSQFLKMSEQNIDHLISDIRTEWFQQFHRPPEPNLLIFILSLLENAVHKVIKLNTTRSFHLHPSVQFLFSKICEEMLASTKHDKFHIDSLCEQMVRSEQLDIEWIARVEHVENGYQLKKITGLSMKTKFQVIASSWFQITEEILQKTGGKKGRSDVFPIPWKNETLLFCINNHDGSSIVPFLTYAMHVLQIEEENYQIHWKDAVILFNEWIMRSKNLDEAIKNIAYGYAHYLPFERCAIFRYSNIEEKGQGLFGYHFNDEEIRSIKENIDNFPSLYKSLARLNPANEALKNFQPMYFSHASEEFPYRYVQTFQLESVVVAPIYVPADGKLIGAAFLDRGPGKFFDVDSNTFAALLKFGQGAGELLSKFTEPEHWPSKDPLLSSREISVLELLAEGASTTEAAEALHLSEYTVRDYVSNIMKRLNARNRTEAAVKAIRLGIIK
ncbi:response regulator transcription factor [Heyndrickxia vini]|uniref:Response regulator transcription factor n=1 Tax=Heyndrickxia vini TaxID=1476025 RepID=A0ABX7E253_9BACI|nr:response regulator transcription factor [Heyndrickxia vini]QQZ09804.1 response regulator transcription factor [Heyndrickxia vini]